MDKLQAILSVSQLVVIDASASSEASICEAFRNQLPSLHFVESSALKREKNSEAFTNPFYILSVDEKTNIKEYLFTLQLQPKNTLLFCKPEEQATIQRGVDFQLYFLNHQDIAISFLQFWEKQLGTALEGELTKAKSSPVFQLIERTLELPAGNSEARARLAFALATQLTVDLHQIKRVIRLALFYPLIAIEDWRQLVNNSEDLVELIPLLEQKLLLGKITLENICPQDLSIDLVIVESALFAQRNLGERENKFRSELKVFSSRLPFKIRTQIRNSAERCFKYLWRENEAA